MLAVVAALVFGCAGGDGGTDPAEAEPILVSLSLSTTTLNVPLGQSRTVTVSIARQGNTSGDVTLGVGGLPTGVTATFEPSVITRTTTSSTLTIAVTPDAPGGRFDLVIFVNGNDVVGGQPPTLTLSMIPPQVTVTRAGPGSGTVISSPAGINCGNSCTASFKATPLTLTATPAAGSTFAGWSGACVASTTTCTFTPSVPASGPNSNNVTATFTAPSFSLALAPTSISTPQGSSTTATVNITRAGGFSGVVNLGFGGLPPGLTITPNPASVTGGSATFTIAAALSLGAGNYPITINATAAGVAQQTATVPVQVTPSPGGSGNITLSFASCDPTQVPIWFAVQNGTGAWTRVMQGTNSTFTFAIRSEGGIAYVTRSGDSYSTAVAFLSESEASSIATGSICGSTPQEGTKSLTTNVLNAATQTVTVTLGGAITTFNPPANQPSGGVPFTLNNFPAGTRDLIAARSTLQTNGLTQLQRIVLRRNTAYPQSATPPAINFIGPESFAPLGRFIALSNLAGDQSSISESFTTVNGGSAAFFESVGTFCQGAGVDCVPWAAVPDSLLQPGDFHAVFIDAAPQGGNVNAGRFAGLLLHAPPAAGPASVTLGPPLATPSVTSLGTTPNIRMRAQLPSQTAYNVAAGADFLQDNITVEVLVTAAYSRGMPATWTIDIPDLSSAGYDPAWGLKNGVPVNWEVSAVGGSFLPFIGATPVDGAQMVGAGVGGSPSASMRLIPWRRLRLP
jgi:trimeric autotransporter adhesin